MTCTPRLSESADRYVEIVGDGLRTMEAERTADREAKYSRFHTCRGSNIALSNDGRTAWRKKGEVRKALVFTEGPIPVGNAFQLKILSDQSMGDLVSHNIITTRCL